MQKGELTMRVGNEAGHFNLDKSLTQSVVDVENCNDVDNSRPISFYFIFDCNCKTPTLLNVFFLILSGWRGCKKGILRKFQFL